MSSRLTPWVGCLLAAAVLAAGPTLSGSTASNESAPQELSQGSGDSVPAALGGPGSGALGGGPNAPQAAGGAPDVVAPANGAAKPPAADSMAAAPVVAPAPPAPVGVPGSWHLVFADDFNTLNTSVWTPYWFDDCDLKSVKNNVKTCSSNVKIANGEAVLQLSDTTSGALLSTNPNDGVAGHTGLEFTTGYAEARIFFPGSCETGIQNWSAWWTAGQDYPATGEIDIAEPLAGDMWSVYHSAAWKKSRIVPGCWGGGYHTYGVLRRAGANDVYYDGQLVHSYATSDNTSPNYLLLNIGVWRGARILGEAGAMRVDYVRVWR